MKGNIFSDYYRGQLMTDAKSRYDITHSTGSYSLFELLLINKKKFNVGGLSFNYGQRPDSFKGNDKRLAEMILSKSSHNISSVYVPNLEKFYIAYGDVQTTNDAIIIVFDEEIKVIELFIARGLKNDRQQLYSEVIDGIYDDEMKAISRTGKEVFKG